MIARASVDGGKSGISPLEIGIKNQTFLEKPEVGILIPNNWFDSCNDKFLLVWNSHCTRVRFTVIVFCSDELAVHSCLFLCLQRWVAQDASGLFYRWSLLRNKHGNKSAKVHFILRWPGFCCMRLLNAHILACR